jgi:hypothetical protein
VRDDAGLLVAEDVVDPAALGGRANGGDLTLRLHVPQPPLEFGRFHVGLELLAADGGVISMQPEACTFVVYPDGVGRGMVRLGGTWSVEANEERQ